MQSDETLPLLEIEGMRVTVPQAVTYVSSGLCLPPTHFSSQCGRETCSLSMHSTASLFSPLKATLQYFSILITGTVGDPLLLAVLPAAQVWLHVSEQSRYDNNYTLLLTLLCQPSLLIHDLMKPLSYMSMHLLSHIKHWCACTTSAADDICMATVKCAISCCKDTWGKGCTRRRNQETAAAAAHNMISRGCEGEDRFNGWKRIAFNLSIGFIYIYSSFNACTSFMLQYLSYVITLLQHFHFNV